MIHMEYYLIVSAIMFFAGIGRRNGSSYRDYDQHLPQYTKYPG